MGVTCGGSVSTDLESRGKIGEIAAKGKCAYLGDEEVEEPRHGRADAAYRRPDVHGRDFRRVQEGHAEEADDVDEVVQEQEEDGCFGRGLVVGLGDQPRQHGHADRH